MKYLSIYWLAKNPGSNADEIARDTNEDTNEKNDCRITNVKLMWFFV